MRCICIKNASKNGLIQEKIIQNKQSQIRCRCKLLENTTSTTQSEFPDLLLNQCKKQKVHCYCCEYTECSLWRNSNTLL